MAAGVKRLVLGKVYRNRDVVEYLQQAGIVVDVYIEDARWNERVQELFNGEIEEKRAEVVVLQNENRN